MELMCGDWVLFYLSSSMGGHLSHDATFWRTGRTEIRVSMMPVSASPNLGRSLLTR